MISVKVPDNMSRVPLGNKGFILRAEQVGVINAPLWAVPELAKAGYARQDGGNASIDVRAALADADQDDLVQYLQYSGVRSSDLSARAASERRRAAMQARNRGDLNPVLPSSVIPDKAILKQMALHIHDLTRQ